MSLTPLMDSETQKLYISTMISNPELFARVHHLLKDVYFDKVFQPTIKFLIDYFQEYRSVPMGQILNTVSKLSFDDQLKIPSSDMKYMSEQIAGFCQIRAITEAVLSAPSLIEKGDFGKMVEDIKTATQIGLSSDLGIDYFEDPAGRILEMETSEVTIKTLWDEFDELTGGIGRQELILFAANSGGGKSVTMLNLAFNLLGQGLNGVYISLEMRDKLVAKRLDSIITNISGKSIFTNKGKVIHELEVAKEGKGRFFIKRMKENVTNANHISAYLRELEGAYGFKPDFVVIDYLDLVACIQKVPDGNMFTKDKFVAEELRGTIGMDHDCIVVSASQLGRCIDVNSLVTLKSGKQIKIKNVKIGDEILSNIGFNVVEAKTPIQKKKCYKVTLENYSSLSITDAHKMPVYTSNGVFISEKTIKSGLSVGDYLFGDWYYMVSPIKSIEEIGEIDTIDIQVSGNHLFYANNILTHNSAITAKEAGNDLSQAHIQGGISKINTADLVVGIVKDEVMDMNGEIRFEFLKSRNSGAVGKKITLAWDNITLRISNLTSQVKKTVLQSVGLTDVIPGKKNNVMNF